MAATESIDLKAFGLDRRTLAEVIESLHDIYVS